MRDNRYLRRGSEGQKVAFQKACTIKKYTSLHLNNLATFLAIFQQLRSQGIIQTFLLLSFQTTACLLKFCMTVKKDNVVLNKLQTAQRASRTYRAITKGKILDLKIKETAAMIKMINYFMV